MTRRSKGSSSAPSSEIVIGGSGKQQQRGGVHRPAHPSLLDAIPGANDEQKNNRRARGSALDIAVLPPPRHQGGKPRATSSSGGHCPSYAISNSTDTATTEASTDRESSRHGSVPSRGSLQQARAARVRGGGGGGDGRPSQSDSSTAAGNDQPSARLSELRRNYYDTLRRERDDARAEASRLREEVEASRAEQEAEDEERYEYARRKWEEERTGLVYEVKTLRGDLEKAEASRREKERERSDRSGSLSGDNDSHIDSAELIRELREELEEVREKCRRSERELEDERKKKKAADGKNCRGGGVHRDRDREDFHLLREELDELRAEHSRSESDWRDAAAEVERYKSEALSLRSDLDEAKTALDVLRSDGKASSPSVNKNIDDLRTRLEASKDVAKTYRRECKAAERKADKLEERLRRRDDELDRMKRALHGEIRRVVALELKLECARDELDALRDDKYDDEDDRRSSRQRYYDDDDDYIEDELSRVPDRDERIRRAVDRSMSTFNLLED